MAIQQDNQRILSRLKAVKIAVFVFLLFMTFQIWYLAVVNYQKFHELALRNQIHDQALVAPRGLILDRNGKILVDNVPNFNLYVLPEDISDREATKQLLLDALEYDDESIVERLNEAVRSGSSRPHLILKDLSIDEISFLLSRRSEYPEIRIMEQPKRRYRFQTAASHILGYVGEVSKQELELPAFASNKGGDIVGKSGIEKVFNTYLTGEDGYARVLVNSVGRVLEEISRRTPKAGDDLQLTIDLDLQQLAEASLEDTPGAVIAFNPKNGEILALASRPGFDPNWFASRMTRAQWLTLTEDPQHPLQNRAIQSAFSPGSIFKVIMVLAGLESGLIDPTTSVYCSGSTVIYGRTFRCWNTGGHGRVAYHEAIQHSCNIFFYMLGQKLGIDRITQFSNMLGLGQLTGIDIGNEVVGNVPSQEWKRRVFGEPWYPGETISVSIGQGPLDVTPMQLARAMGMVATGLSPELHLVMSPENEKRKAPVKDLGFSPENLARVRKAMWSVVNEYGTGRGARVSNFDVCGKTGTAQLISRETMERLSVEERKKFEPNAWFVGFAPLDDPEIVVTVIVQRGGSGSAAASPLAGKILQHYYEHNHPKVPEDQGMVLAAAP